MTLTPQEARAVSSAAYAFVYPLVLNYASMYREAIDPSSTSFSGGFGSWLHRRVAMTSESSVASAHTTTLHSSVWLDLRAEPWTLELPALHPGGAHLTRISDLWSFVIDEGSDDRSSAVLLASPTWHSEVPDTVDRVVRGDSAFVRCEIRFVMRTPGDLADVWGVQPQFAVRPLSSHCASRPPPPTPVIRWRPVPHGVETADEFWSVANLALSLTTTNHQDRAMLERIALVGVVAGKPWCATSFDREVREAIDEGVDDAISEIMRAAGGVDPAVIHRSREDTDRDYIGRALSALSHGSMLTSNGA